MLETQEQRTEGMKRQAQELIEQAYDRGYKAGEEQANAIIDEQKTQWIEQGRNEAWEAARKIGQNSQSMLEYQIGFDFSKMKSYESANPSWWVVMNYSASESIEKLKAWEQKQQEDEIRVGDEVRDCDSQLYTVISISTTNKICGIDARGFWVTCDYDSVVRTSKHYDEIAQILAKMKEEVE